MYLISARFRPYRITVKTFLYQAIKGLLSVKSTVGADKIIQIALGVSFDTYVNMQEQKVRDRLHNQFDH